MPPKKTPADYHALAEKRGFRWLGPEVRNTRIKTGWECEQGHSWRATYSTIQQGYGCPHCAVTNPKTHSDYHALAERRGLRWLGPEVANTTIETWWECERGHRWEAPYSYLRQGAGCPLCARKRKTAPNRKGPAAYHALAKERGFRWLGPEVPSVKTKTRWECQEGHQWETTYERIRLGRGCHVCTGAVPKTFDDYRQLATSRGFRWLGPQVANTHVKTTWECPQGHHWEAAYHSIQQGSGCPVCALVGMADSNRKKPADYHALAAERGFDWLGPEVDYVTAKTSWGCGQGHNWEATYNSIQQGTGCPVCAGNVRKTAVDYHRLAADCDFVWLGTEVANTSTKTGWECGQGHRWEARYDDIKRGVGCPYCANRVPKTRSDYHDLAEERGFLWLGPEVADTSVPTNWQCDQGHRWEAPYGRIQQGHGCLICAGKSPKVPADYHALAEERGFLWLGPNVPNNQTLTLWECEQGHQWEAHYNAIQQGRGCPHCLDMVHGARVSQVQRDLCDMLGGELNKPVGTYNLDVALVISDALIAVEYDAWYWHAGREEDDARRDTEMIAAGWRVLRIRSNAQLPTREQLDAAIDRLLGGERRVEIVLDDWGVGPTRFGLD